MEGRISRRRHSEAPGATPFSDEEKDALLDLAYKVVTTHQEHFVITVPSSLSALVLYWSYQFGTSTATVDAVVDACERVCQEVQQRGHRIDVQPRGATESSTSIRHGLSAGLAGWLSPLHPAAVLSGPILDYSGAMPASYCVNIDEIPADPVFGTILLGHQRNELLHVFAAEAIAVAAVVTLSHTVTRPSKRDVYREFCFVHDLLHNEVILRWKTEDDSEQAFDAALDRLQASKCLAYDGSTLQSTGNWFTSFLASLVLPFIVTSTVVTEWWLANPAAHLDTVRSLWNSTEMVT